MTPTRRTATAPDRPWLDPALDVERRVDLLVDAMTTEEKAAQLTQVDNLEPGRDADLLRRGVGSSLYASGATAGNVRDGGVLASAVDECQRLAVEGSRLGVPVLFGRDVIHGHRTVAPIPLGLAATFDVDLLRRVSALAAREASTEGVAWTFAPMMDISEEPRWGRVAESLGESPVLAGRLAAAMVEGFQGTARERRDGAREQQGGRPTLGATAKHYVGYGLVQGGRDYDTVTVGENTLRNLHLRPFRDAVDAGVMAVMAAFNDVDGVPMHAHRHLLRDVLKGEWGFDGVVVADWNGIGQLVNQGVAADLRDAARQALLAGVDLDMCSGAYLDHLPDLVEDGEVPLDLVDDAVRRVLRMKLRLGLFESPYTDPSRTLAAPGPQERALAREAAARSMVLVKNDGLLPLHANIGKIHLAGPFVHDGDALLGTWVLDGRGEEVVTPAQAFAERLAAEDLVVSDGRFSDVAMSMVREAEVTVAVVGEHRSRSGEDRCISTLELPAGQLEVLEEMAGLGKPLVVVVHTGRPLELGRVLELADAVLVAWHPGTEAGHALTDVVFGDVSPSGRLPMTFPRTVGHIPSSSHERPTGRPIDRDRDRQLGRYLNSLVFPELTFGYGLTYTHMEYGDLEASRTTLPVKGNGSVSVSVEVTNTGVRAGREVVQLYVRDLVADVTRPLVELADWRVVDLEPGESTKVVFKVTPRMFGYHDRELRWRVDPGEVDVMVGPNAAYFSRVRLTLVDGK
ncbi:glycoside hydrolase family 3 N-terminal domain-containing protein [Lapillicoccus jejuensis]|uniref:beta-glucosidase n=1 Tax=Lapillicoccus jejuensis TaxID=402171 RepID=A0A542DYC3_9MICO|nr:glycoside hydrolase family 3 N-terminal domain-containing protein [Lapillicoccus jejuensis]TQJ08087.1 beta-glucosidase [Lapillicoccus jejuensis]